MRIIYLSRYINLLEETLEALKEHNKTPEDVKYIYDNNSWFTWEDFKQLANVKYYSGYGTALVDRNLVIVGKDFWLEREEYDGSEWWEYEPYKFYIPKPSQYKKPETLFDAKEYHIIFSGNGLLIYTEVIYLFDFEDAEVYAREYATSKGYTEIKILHKDYKLADI